MIAVDVSNSETDLVQLHSVVQTALPLQERNAIYEIFAYVFGQSDKISDRHLETIVESDIDHYPDSDEPDTVEELRQHIEFQRDSTPSINTSEDVVPQSLVPVMKYVFRGEEKNKAIKSQKRAIYEDYDLHISFPVSNLIKD